MKTTRLGPLQIKVIKCLAERTCAGPDFAQMAANWVTADDLAKACESNPASVHAAISGLRGKRRLVECGTVTWAGATTRVYYLTPAGVRAYLRSLDRRSDELNAAAELVRKARRMHNKDINNVADVDAFHKELDAWISNRFGMDPEPDQRFDSPRRARMRKRMRASFP